MITLENVDFSYDEKVILKNFSLKVKKGECVCLTGDSGCGKTTVLRLISGLETPDFGTVISPKKISYVFQEDRLVPHLSVLNNINICIPKEKRMFSVPLLEEAGLKNVITKKPEELSGGMKRRVSIVRSVAFDGDALLLDEPFNGLDLESKKKMAEMIKREFILKNKPVVMISHIPEDAELLNARIVKM